MRYRYLAVILALSVLPIGNVSAEEPVLVNMQTSMGDIQLELYADKAPITVKNFVDYANSGFYDGTIFHRVIDGFMIQGVASRQIWKKSRPGT
ncbi:MAG: peptidylprolyl isomerase [Pirellulaceae bacterium]